LIVGWVEGEDVGFKSYVVCWEIDNLFNKIWWDYEDVFMLLNDNV